MRTSPRSCRQRKCTQPSRVYLMAFDTRLLKICCTSEGSLCTQSVHSSTCSFRPLFAARLAKSLRSSSEQRGHSEVRQLGFDCAGFKLADVEQGVQEPRHRPDRLFLLSECIGGIRFTHDTAQGAIEKGEALEGLAQIVACRGEKAALGQIRTIGLVARTRRSVAFQDQLGLDVPVVRRLAEVRGQPRGCRLRRRSR